MRDYSMVSPTFWTRGGAGKELGANQEAKLLTLYLKTNPAANMLGLYYLPLPFLAHEISMDLQKVRDLFTVLEAAGIAYYDEHAELVYVPGSAKMQMGEGLKLKDTRRARVIKELAKLEGHRFAQMFLERYGEAYKLHLEWKGHRGPIDGALMGHSPPIDAPPKPHQWGSGSGEEEGTGDLNTRASSAESSSYFPPALGNPDPTTTTPPSP